ncbi:MAG: ATP-binding protein [Phycisphaerales bacterium]|nr:ATP-binding protein [Phycisphaerales bacterium]
MDPWYKVISPRKEVREGRSFNPDEFAIALEQVVAGTAPKDYTDPKEFFKRTCFTRALREHSAMALRRLLGQTGNTAPVMALVTQFGGGKTHTLTTLYHMTRGGITLDELRTLSRTADEKAPHTERNWLDEFKSLPKARVAAFVGNAWDPQEGAETPWIDLARQLAGEAGIKALGKDALNTPPGTTALANVFAAANAPVVVLFDEVLNFLNRHRGFAESFHAFIQNLTVAVTGTTHGVAMISLPRSQVEMTEWDQEWQARITKVVKRVAKDLIVNDEGEIAEVVRRRLFEGIDSAGVIKSGRAVAKAYADWCFERRERIPPEWTAVDAASTESKAKDFLRRRFEACYPFHPATLSVFQRKWQTLPQYQQTRGTLAMLAQWVSWAFVEQHQRGINEPLLTLGRAPLHDPGFASVVLGQLGEPRLGPAISADIAGESSHAKALDADTKAALRDIHRRVGAAILFESSGGQADKVSHLPELRFALGEPSIETTSIDNAAIALEKKGYFIRKAGTDGFRFGFQPTLKKVVADRKASLDEDEDVRKPMRKIVLGEFQKKPVLTIHPSLVTDGEEVGDTPRLTVAIVDPDTEADDRGDVRRRLAEWTRKRGASNRVYPGSLIWCVRKPGRELRNKVEIWQAWRRVKQEIDDGTLQGEFEQADRGKVSGELTEATGGAVDEVWASYRFVFVADPAAEDGLKMVDLSAGHASAGQSLTERIVFALRSEGLLNESVGAGYLERNWPPALKESGAWPLSSLRQAFLNGALTRLLDTDGALRTKIVEFVRRGDFGLASGPKTDGTYDRLWFEQPVDAAEATFEAQVFLLTKARATALLRQPAPEMISSLAAAEAPQPGATRVAETGPTAAVPDVAGDAQPAAPARVVVRLVGNVTPEIWNRIGVKLLPRLRSSSQLRLGINFECEIEADQAPGLQFDLRQALEDLRLTESVRLVT